MNKYDDVIMSCNGLIYNIIGKFFKGFDTEDLYQVGVLGVIKAYNNYNKHYVKPTIVCRAFHCFL